MPRKEADWEVLFERSKVWVVITLLADAAIEAILSLVGIAVVVSGLLGLIGVVDNQTSPPMQQLLTTLGAAGLTLIPLHGLRRQLRDGLTRPRTIEGRVSAVTHLSRTARSVSYQAVQLTVGGEVFEVASRDLRVSPAVAMTLRVVALASGDVLSIERKR